MDNLPCKQMRRFLLGPQCPPRVHLMWQESTATGNLSYADLDESCSRKFLWYSYQVVAQDTMCT